MRMPKEFSLNNTIKTLYCALERPILNYGLLICGEIDSGRPLNE